MPGYNVDGAKIQPNVFRALAKECDSLGVTDFGAGVIRSHAEVRLESRDSTLVDAQTRHRRFMEMYSEDFGSNS
jgi:hypothetical protein